MDNYYLYIVGFLGILLVAYVVFYYLKRRSKYANEIHHQDIECDGDTCSIPLKQDDTNYTENNEANEAKCNDDKCYDKL